MVLNLDIILKKSLFNGRSMEGHQNILLAIGSRTIDLCFEARIIEYCININNNITYVEIETCQMY